MLLQGAHSKTTVRNQPLQQSQVPQKRLPKLRGGGGGTQSTKRLRHRQKFFDLRKGRKNAGGPGIDGRTEVVCSLRGYEIRLLVYHYPEGVTKREQILDVLFGHSLRRGEDQQSRPGT